MLEDMLRACVLDHKGSWEEHFPLVEFSYNNSYQASIQMAPDECLKHSYYTRVDFSFFHVYFIVNS